MQQVIHWEKGTVDVCAISLATAITVNITKNGINETLLTVLGLYLCSLYSMMKSALTDATSWRFHYSPFKRFWTLPPGANVHCYDEAYTSDEWIEEHNKLQKQKNEPGCKLEKVILGLMFWSDSTHLSSFRTAKVWSLYMYFAKLLKYIRCKPSSGAAHHIAYIPLVRNCLCLSQVDMTYCLQFLASGLTARLNSQKTAITAHCRRDLMHGVWDQIMDDKFVACYKHGFVMECLDRVW